MAIGELEVIDIPSLRIFKPQQTVRAFWEIFRKYDFDPLEEFDGINIAQHKKAVAERTAEQGMAAMAKRVGTQYLKNNKVEKLHFGWTVIRDAMLIPPCMGCPSDDYDFPALAVTWDKSEKHVHIIADIIPLVNLVMHEGYLEKYLSTPLSRSINGIRAFWMPLRNSSAGFER